MSYHDYCESRHITAKGHPFYALIMAAMRQADTDNLLRLQLAWRGVKFLRIALNMNQIEQYDPPPNPAKITDSRAEAYIAEFGSESWELDALEPAVLTALIEETVLAVRDEKRWSAKLEQEEEGRRELTLISDRYDDVSNYLSELEE